MKHNGGKKLNTLEGIRPLLLLAVAIRNDKIVRSLLEWIDKYDLSIKTSEDLFAYALDIDKPVAHADIYSHL